MLCVLNLATVGTIAIVGHRRNVESGHIWPAADTHRSRVCRTSLRGLRRRLYRHFSVMASRGGTSHSRSLGYDWGGNLSGGRRINPVGPTAAYSVTLKETDRYYYH